MNLTEKSVVLTGATGGIGSALAQSLHNRGARLILVGRNRERLDALLQQLNGHHSSISADLNTESGRQTLLEALRASDTQPDMLINNAGITDFSFLATQSASNIASVITSNLISPMLLTHTVLPVLNPSSSRILNIGSTFGSIGYPGFTAYSASKFGLRGFSEALSRELADTNTRVQYAAPRATRTPLNSSAVDNMNSHMGNHVDDPADLANQIADFIESDKPTLIVGWPERFFVFINTISSGLVSRALRQKLPTIKRYAQEV